MVNIMDVREEEYIYPGTRMCSGCAMALIYRFALKALGPKTLLTVPASCLTVLHGMQGFCTTKVSVLHTPFATTGASASGIVASLEEKGLADEICVVAFAGDGGTADIGLQALSGAAERGTNFIYACYDNEAYMNTGVQRSGATPYGASTATTPGGKIRPKKNMPKILEAHGISYVATANGSYPLDLYEKFQKAREIKGTRYIHILSPCPPGWGYDPKDTIKLGKLANETGFWPLYEIINGKLIISKPSKKYLDTSKRKPIEEYLMAQKRFKHLSPEDIEEYTEYVNGVWKDLKSRLDSQ
ncbi:MAG: pyruvate synthase subunit beta [Promethearchaeota archaeon]|nr:MAG: pyruvate synthase subunit beta [Candidatus Lokiarchaeota archaeon]